MPESLQSSPTGELLQERIDALENAISDVENVDLDYDEPDEDELKSEAMDELGYSVDNDDDDDTEEGEESEEGEDAETEAEKEAKIEEVVERLRSEKMQEFVDEKIEELQSVSLE